MTSAAAGVALTDAVPPSSGVVVDGGWADGEIAGPLDFDVHPTNVGHAFIAKQFESAWNDLN